MTRPRAPRSARLRPVLARRRTTIGAPVHRYAALSRPQLAFFVAVAPPITKYCDPGTFPKSTPDGEPSV